MATINTNSAGTTGTTVNLTTETVVTLYNFPTDLTHNNYRLGLEFSPDNTNWVEHPNSIVGKGFMTVTIAASQVRAKVILAEGETSTVNYFIVSR